MKVNWDDGNSQYMEKYKSCSKPPTRYPNHTAFWNYYLDSLDRQRHHRVLQKDSHRGTFFVQDTLEVSGPQHCFHTLKVEEPLGCLNVSNVLPGIQVLKAALFEESNTQKRFVPEGSTFRHTSGLPSCSVKGTEPPTPMPQGPPHCILQRSDDSSG